MDLPDDPPPKMAIRCPTDNDHAAIVVREGWFYCYSCEDRYQDVRDARLPEEEDWVSHREFVDAWGVVEYHDYVP